MGKIKILAVDIGHNCSYDGGAVGIKSEDELNVLVGRRLLERLTEVDVKVVFCSPNSASSLSNSLSKRVAAANKAKADFFLSIHHNACVGGYGSECLCILGGVAESTGRSILNELSKLGLRNRGVKARGDLHVIRNTVMPALVVECAFVDSSSDMKSYNAIAAGDAIFNGVVSAFDLKRNGVSGGGQSSGSSGGGQAPPPIQGGQIYVVKRGDSLWGIARRFDSTVRKISRDNGIKNTNVIYIGQKLRV